MSSYNCWDVGACILGTTCSNLGTRVDDNARISSTPNKVDLSKDKSHPFEITTNKTKRDLRF